VTTNLRSRVRAGDQIAFGELFDEHADRVYQHVSRLLGDWSAAEDAASLTFLEAWRTRERLDPDGGSLLPWLLGIEPDFADELAGQLDDAGQLRDIRTALDGLRRAEREVVALCIYADLDYAAAAEALGVPIGTVRSRLSRAKARLRAAARTAPQPAPAASITRETR
jgi:RNA polymerase sigma-70 factor (ECF subfamily)